MEVTIEADDSLRGSTSAFRAVLAGVKAKGVPALAQMDESNPPPPPPPPPRRLDASADLSTQQQAEQADSIPKKSASSRKGGTGSGPPISRGTEFGAQNPGRVKATKKEDRFKGQNPLEYALWAHYLSYGSAFVCFICGVFGVAWDSPSSSFPCAVNGQSIASKYRTLENNQCNTSYVSIVDQQLKLSDVCCRGDVKGSITGSTPIGSLFMIYSLLIVAFEDTNFGFGLFYPTDSISYDYKFSAAGILHALVGIVGCSSYVTALAGVCLLVCCAVMQYAALRGESGDGGRAVRNEAKIKALMKAKKDAGVKESSADTDIRPRTAVTALCHDLFSGIRDAAADYIPSFRFKLVDPRVFCLRIYNEDKLSSYVWAGIFGFANLMLFSVTWVNWQRSIDSSRAALVNGTLDVSCDSSVCSFNRQMIKSGPMSNWAPLAKACGACLNLDCSLLILPVIKILLRKLNNAGESLAAAQNSTDYWRKLFARPITRYVPLQKNIEFHKVCAYTVLFFSVGHILAHLANLRYADETTLAYFKKWGWSGTDFFTGSVVTFAFVMILSASSNFMRNTKYEIFFSAHHFFVIFYLFMFLHGPNFYIWSIIPVTLYLVERYLQILRGNQPFLITKVEWIAPVMSVYFRPVLPNTFTFKEGQYLYLNCPFVSKSEWHPFTISSAVEDLSCGRRVSLATGEDVAEVPRPSDLEPGSRWNYFYPVSRDWRTMTRDEYLEKGDTDYHDYVSVHIRVHGLDDSKAKSWTRRLKEYFELIAAGGGQNKFPFFFTRREPRGDTLMGRLLGPDGTPILRVDGPHSAPSEHYINYGTVMLIGAGIGLTPCASILTALTRYRWKRNFNPEILHFYWMVRQNEIDSYQWFIHALTELSFEMKRAREAEQIDSRYYLEINVYVTGIEKGRVEPKPFYRSKQPLGDDSGRGPQPYFQAEDLYEALLNPTVPAKHQIDSVKTLKRFSQPGQANEAPNRFQEIFIWNGRPDWDSVFAEMKEARQTSDIGVCFCGAAPIGADLQNMCQKYSSSKDDAIFTLHKENF